MAVTLLGAAALIAQLCAIDGGPLDAPPVAPTQATQEPDENPPQPIYTVWDRLAQCESTSRWSANTGNGYYGGVQMDMTFWRRHGGGAYASRPDLASRNAQIAVAERGLAVQGWSAWPACSRKLGLR